MHCCSDDWFINVLVLQHPTILFSGCQLTQNSHAPCQSPGLCVAPPPLPVAPPPPSPATPTRPSVQQWGKRRTGERRTQWSGFQTCSLQTVGCCRGGGRIASVYKCGRERVRTLGRSEQNLQSSPKSGDVFQTDNWSQGVPLQTCATLAPPQHKVKCRLHHIYL